MKLEKFKALGLSLMLAASLSACSKFGDFEADKNVATINQQQLHQLTYSAGDNFDLSVYYPVNPQNAKTPSKQTDPRMTQEIADVYGNAEVDRFIIHGTTFSSDKVIYMVKDIGSVSNQNQLSEVLSQTHNKKDMGIIGNYVEGKFNLEIHQMRSGAETDPIYVAVVHPRHAGDYSKNIDQDNVVSNYNNSTIHQVVFNQPQNETDEPRLYFSLNDKGELLPLSSESVYKKGKHSYVINSNIVLLDEAGHLIENNQLTEKELVKLNKSVV